MFTSKDLERLERDLGLLSSVKANLDDRRIESVNSFVIGEVMNSLSSIYRKAAREIGYAENP